MSFRDMIHASDVFLAILSEMILTMSKDVTVSQRYATLCNCWPKLEHSHSFYGSFG